MRSPNVSSIALEPSQIEAFHGEGFVRVDAVFTPSEMDEIEAAFDRLHTMAEAIVPADLQSAQSGSGDYKGTHVTHGGARFTFSAQGFVRHVAMCGNAEPVLRRYGRDARLLAIAAALLGSREMDQIINQAHFKRPGSGIAFDWHQDSQHRGMSQGGFVDVNGRGSYVQIALAIDDATEENGPLKFIPGSNRLGHRNKQLEGVIDPATAVAPLLKRGDIAAFGPFTVHGSEANRSQHWRRVFINGFAYPGANRRDYGMENVGERVVAV